MDTSEVITAVTDRVRESANVKAVFGEPVDLAGGITIIPVAAVRVAGGGGGGGSKADASDGENGDEGKSGKGNGLGLGIRVTTVPLGYIEAKEGNAKFVSITDATKIAVSGLLTTSILLLSLNRVMRLMAWKKWHKKKHRHGWRH
jgi:uncharacterized spore protein YtfJ